MQILNQRDETRLKKMTKIKHILQNENDQQPRIMVRAAFTAVQGSPTESRRDFATPFPVPSQRMTHQEEEDEINLSEERLELISIEKNQREKERAELPISSHQKPLCKPTKSIYRLFTQSLRN